MGTVPCSVHCVRTPWMPRAAPRLAAVGAMDAEGGTALTAVKNNPHALRSASETTQEGHRGCQCHAAARARNT